MPLFEFECNNCEHRFEELVSFSVVVKPVCPECSGHDVQKLVSAGSIRANGISANQCGNANPTCSPSGG